MQRHCSSAIARLRTTLPRSQKTPYIRSLYWDHTTSHPNLMRTLNYFHRANNMKLNNLVTKAWYNVTIFILQRARNVQTIIEVLVYNHSRSGKLRLTMRQLHVNVLEPCGITLVQTILYAHLTNPPASPPINTPSLSQIKHAIPSEHDRCTL